MTKPTRADKLQMILSLYELAEAYASKAGMFLDRKCREYQATLLADYAPISEERRAELEARKRYLSRKCEQYTQSDAVFYNDWLAEIDAELEGDDG